MRNVKMKESTNGSSLLSLCLLLLSTTGPLRRRVCAAELDVTAYYTRTAESLQKLKKVCPDLRL